MVCLLFVDSLLADEVVGDISYWFVKGGPSVAGPLDSVDAEKIE